MKSMAAAALGLLAGIASGCVEEAESKPNNKSINPVYQTVDLPSLEDRQRLKRSPQDPYGGIPIVNPDPLAPKHPGYILLNYGLEVDQSIDGSGTVPNPSVPLQGAKVHIDQQAGEWSEIVLQDGKVGWGRSESFESN